MGDDRKRQLPSSDCLPDWLPSGAKYYLEHVASGKTLRSIARSRGCHASTVMRQVRRLENRRDDVLVDEALDHISKVVGQAAAPDTTKDYSPMSVEQAQSFEHDSSAIDREARRILRRLCETAAFLVVGANMDKAVVMRETVQGDPTRIAVVERTVVHAFALKDWIECVRSGKIASYRISNAGRAALKRLLAEDQRRKGEATEDPYSEQHKVWGERHVVDAEDGIKKIRYNLAESPMTALARKKSRDGAPFLSAGLLQAGERLREDFELSQMGPRITQNWDRFLTGTGGYDQSGGGSAVGPSDARGRLSAALSDLGPGLADIALRCCCFLEGLETAEKRMGWSARSGKIVLRIALQRLRVHYDALHGGARPMIG